MGISLGSNFDVQTGLPLDSRDTVADVTARDAISALRRYEGMMVYVVADGITYQLVGGITNGDWVEYGSGVVTLAGTQAITNKDYDGGTASDTSRITLPQDVKSNLDGLTRKEGTIVYATDQKKAYLDDGSALIAVGSGGGGGGSIEWIPDANAPIAAVENGQRVWAFGAGLEQKLYALIKVPASYIAGSPMTAKICMYSDSTSGDIQMQTVTTLIRKGVDAVTSTTNQRTSTNAAFTTSAGTVDEPNEIEFDLSSATGTVNGVDVSAGDLLFVMLTRATSGDTSAAEAKILPYSTEVAAS